MSRLYSVGKLPSNKGHLYKLHHWISDWECDRWTLISISEESVRTDGASSLCARCTCGVTRVRAVGMCCSFCARGSCSSSSTWKPIILCWAASSNSSSIGTLTVTRSGCWGASSVMWLHRGCSVMTSSLLYPPSSSCLVSLKWSHSCKDSLAI